MNTSSTRQYTGRITSTPGNDGYVFIAINSVRKEDGTPHGLDTTADIFLHADDCNTELHVGMTVKFHVVPDPKRGNGHYRAEGATQYSEKRIMKLVPTGAPGENQPPAVASPEVIANAMAPDPDRHQEATPASPEEVADVLNNKPFGELLAGLITAVPEESGELRAAGVEKFLHSHFVRLDRTGVSFELNADNTKAIRAAIERYSKTNMHAQAQVFEDQTTILTRVLGAFKHLEEKGQLNANCMLPGKFFPELLMAAPVLYFDDDGDGSMFDMFNLLVGTDPFAAILQLYNPSPMVPARPLSAFSSQVDVMPMDVLSEIELGTTVFDHLVIATPYHDVASRAWAQARTRRQVDPYLFGFIKGFPFIFLLGRWSGTGMFPLFPDMVTSTLKHLSDNMNNIKAIREYTWRGASGAWRGSTQLINHVSGAMKAYEAGNLFAYLRGEVPEPTTPAA